MDLPDSGVRKEGSLSPLPHLDIKSGDSLIPFYQSLVGRYCEPGDNPDTYGETAYIDADLITIIHDRVNIGRYVAEVKGESDSSIYEIKDNDELLMAKLKDRPREESLLLKVAATAGKYDLNPAMAVDAFKWMIDKTLDIEIAYLRQVGR
jgi:chorismate mutase